MNGQCPKCKGPLYPEYEPLIHASRQRCLLCGRYADSRPATQEDDPKRGNVKHWKRSIDG